MKHIILNCTTGQIETIDDGLPLPEVTPEPMSFTPREIVTAMTSMGIAETILSNVDAVTLARFYTASSILETEPILVSALQAVGKTVDDLKANINV